MSLNQFDVATKELVWEDPAAWLVALGIAPNGPVEIIESEASTLTAWADKVIRVNATEPYLVHLEFQSSHETDLVRKLWYRQVALDHRHGLPVLTVLLLLRSAANSPSLTGRFERRMPDKRLTNRYHYQVVRLWREEVMTFLDARVSLAPLAPLAKVTRKELPGLVRRLADLFNRESEPRAEKLRLATYLLMGLRYPDELVDQLTEGVWHMQESTTYRKILRDGLEQGLQQGRLAEARLMVLRRGRKQFGEPDSAAVAALEAIQDVERIEALLDQILDSGIRDWRELVRASQST